MSFRWTWPPATLYSWQPGLILSRSARAAAAVRIAVRFPTRCARGRSGPPACAVVRRGAGTGGAVPGAGASRPLCGGAWAIAGDAGRRTRSGARIAAVRQGRAWQALPDGPAWRASARTEFSSMLQPSRTQTETFSLASAGSWASNTGKMSRVTLEVPWVSESLRTISPNLRRMRSSRSASTRWDSLARLLR